MHGGKERGGGGEGRRGGEGEREERGGGGEGRKLRAQSTSMLLGSSL